MNKQITKRVIAIAAILTLLVIGAALTSGPVQALASANAQATVVVPTVAVTAIIPGTGDPGPSSLWTSWIFWVIAGAVLLAVVLALVARSAAPPVDHTHHDDL